MRQSVRPERIEGKQDIAGQSGTNWEMDARGWAEDGKTFVVVECKKHKGTKISQAIVGSLDFTIQDTRAVGWFVASPHGLQAGAQKIAAAAKAEEIKLDPASTPDAFFGEWLGSLQAGFADTVTASMSERVQIKLFNADGKLNQDATLNKIRRLRPSRAPRRRLRTTDQARARPREPFAYEQACPSCGVRHLRLHARHVQPVGQHNIHLEQSKAGFSAPASVLDAVRSDSKPRVSAVPLRLAFAK